MRRTVTTLALAATAPIVGLALLAAPAEAATTATPSPSATNPTATAAAPSAPTRALPTVAPSTSAGAGDISVPAGNAGGSRPDARPSVAVLGLAGGGVALLAAGGLVSVRRRAITR